MGVKQVAANADGSVVIVVDMSVDDAEKELGRLKSKIFRLEDNLSQNNFKKNMLVEQLKAANEEIDALQNKGKTKGKRIIFDPGDIEKISAIGGKIREIEAQIQKCDKAIADSNLNLDAAKNRYGEIAAEIERLRGAGQTQPSSAAEDPHLQKMAEDAKTANDRITELQARMTELQQQRAKLGLAIGARDEYNDLTAQIEAVDQEILSCEEYLDQLAENDSLGKLADGAEIAEQRINDLTQYLENLEEQNRKLGLAFKAQGQREELLSEIAEVERLLDAYRRNLDTAASSDGMRHIADDAEIANQHIVELNQELLEMEQRKKELSEAGQGLGYQEYDQLVAEIAEAKRELREYEKALSESSGGTEEQVSRTAQAMEKLSSIAGKVKGLLSPKGSEIPGQLLQAIEAIAPKLTGKIVPAIEAVSGAIGGIVTKLTPVLAVLGVVLALVKRVAREGVKMAQQFAGAVKSAASGLWKAGGTLAGWLSKGAASAKKFGSTAVSAFSEAAKSFGKLMKELNVFPKLADAIGSKLKRLGQMIRRVFVFSVITSGLRALRSQVSAYLSLNEQFSTALRRLQGVLLTAFQPIYDVIVPALTTLIQVLSQAIAVVVQFFSSLFGTTAKKAQANAKALYGQSKALKETGKAADEAAGSLAAFDEINTIETEKDSGGGGGGGAADTGPLFDWEYDDESFGSWGEAFSAFLDKLLDGLPKLEAAFKKFADWLNDFAKKLYDMFTFPGVLDKVKALGKGLAEALNKLVNWIDWELLGRALGAGLNLALNFLTSFLYAFDWFNLGKKLAEFVNGLVDEIDWYEFGRLLWAGFKIALETLAGFIMGLDMPLMAQAAGNVIKGFFDEMYNTIQRIPWFRIGAQIASFLNNIDWYGCLTTAIRAIQAALQAMQKLLAGFVISLQWSDIAKQIYTAINDSFGRISWSQIGRTLGDAFVQVFNFAREIAAGIDWHQIGENIAKFILGFDFVSALSSLGQLIAAGINAAVQLACGFLDQVGPELRSIAEGITNGMREAIEAVDWSWAGEVIGRGIQGALAFVTGLLDPETFYAIGKAIGDFLVGLDWVGIVGGLAEVLANAIQSAVAAVRGFLDSVQPNLKEIADGIAQKINEFVAAVDWAELGRTIHDGIDAALDFLLELLDTLDWDGIGQAVVDFLTNLDWGGLLIKWGTVVGKALGGALRSIDLSDAIWLGNSIVDGWWRGMLEKWDESGGILGWIKRSLFSPFIDGFKSLFGIHSPSTVMAELGGYLIAGLLQGITESWNGIIEFFNGGWESVKTAASAAWESIKTTLSGIWENLKTTAQSSFENIKTAISTAWENTKTKTTEIWNNIKTALATAWDNLKTAAKEKFENIKTAISTAWENVKSKTTETWNSIKTTLSTLWNELKTTAVNAFNEIKNKVVEAWTNIKNEAVSKWNEIKSTISSRVDEIKSAVSSKFTEIKSSISQAWENVRSSTSSVWDGIKSTVGGALSEIAGKVSSTFSGIVSSAKSWGSDIASNISSGISGAANKVKSAVTGVANKIKSNLHFSEPDEGPLKDFHTYMPDMLALMAKGIRDNTHLAVNAASDLAESIANTVSGKGIGVDMAMPDISKFSIPLVAQGAKLPGSREFTMVMQSENGNGDSLARMEKMMGEMLERMGNMEIIIKNEIPLDGKIIARNTVRHINDFTRSAGRPVIDF